jgi:hypothetical protein
MLFLNKVCLTVALALRKFGFRMEEAKKVAVAKYGWIAIGWRARHLKGTRPR